MKTTNRMFLLSILSALSAAAAAADSATGTGGNAVDTSKWECKSCPIDKGTSGTLDAGVGYVSQDSFKFGEYTGLNKKGGFFIGDGSVRFRGEDGAYWNANATNLGLSSRSLDAEGGTQGKYKLLFKYDEIPHYLSKVLTPFNGSGGSSLTLPAAFPIPSTFATTGAMPLAGTVQQVDLVTDRKRLGVGGSWIPVRNWEYAVNFRHETREGTKRTAGSFFFNSAQLVEPVDYVTDQVDASASYRGGKLQAKFAYYGSNFRNSNDSLTWQNPFTVPAFFGAVGRFGQLALPPDNQFHQLLASAGYDFSTRTRFTADISVGRMTQNEGFLPFTPSANVFIPPLPAVPSSSLNGRAATLDANLKVTSAVTDKLRLNASYTHNNRDNQTPQATYTLVSTDLFATPTLRTNLPYSFTRDKLKFNGDYRFSALTKASAGIDHDTTKRTFQEADKTSEDTFWGKITSRALDKVDLTFKLARGERRNSGYLPVSQIVVPDPIATENPLLRKYNMANRTRDTAGLRADFAVTESVNLGVGLDMSNDKYRDSTIGLISGRDYSLNGDLNVVVTEQTSLHLFANHQEIESRQAGSGTFSDPDWSGEIKDRIDFIGVGVKHAAIKDKLDLGADYVISRARSRITVIAGAADPAFPNITTTLDSVKLYAAYRLKDNVSLRVDFWHERFDSRNWMLDGVTPNTIPNVLTFGEVAPRYRLNVIRLAVRYKF